MRQQIKFLLSFLSIGFLLLMSSCEKEIYDDAIYQSQHPQNLSISKISFNELKSNKKAVEKIKSVITKKLPNSIAQRAVYNEDFGVLIDTTNIVQVTSTTEQSITFNIVDYTDSTKKENLILVSKNDGSFEAYIAEYELTQQELDILASGGTIENIQPTSISEIESTSKFAVSGDCVITNTFTVGMCEDANGNDIVNNGNSGNDCVRNWYEIDYQVITLDMACLSGGGGSDSSSGSTGNTTGSTGSNSGYSGSGNLGNGSVNTTYVGCSNCPDISLELEEFLSNLTSDQLNWWNNPRNRNAVESIEGYLSQNNFNAQSNQFVNELIDLAIENNATFQFDDSIDSSNSLVFNTIQDFENHLETNLATLEETDFEIDAQNQRIATAKLSYGTFGITIKVKQNMLPTYEVVNVSSVKTGLSILLSYEQTDYNVDIVGSYVNVDVYGLATTGIKITVPFEANITFEDEVHFRVVIDKNTGHLITAYEIND
ncbi:MAG TPA: hypothetical protein VK164_06875 [Flavobacterium sp.]|uniref:hypothetical protein n=1 Tax=Flavobacterium sp. TaxID=239 RepID=UPI002B4B24B3|nr:hypothetical protein [Flavobacterium sp.]HLO73641.1 hypothetical protein [Flavobacterium sp.]